MIPMREPFNDARRNLISSIVLAGSSQSCEVSVFFNDGLLRGNRAVKCDASGFAAFSSPNHPPLATVGAAGVSAQNRHLWRPPPSSRLRIHSNLDARVVVVRLTPGFDDGALVAMVQHTPNLRGLVLSLYGTGNGPSHKAAFVELIERAIEREIVVVAVTQCFQGAVSLDTSVVVVWAVVSTDNERPPCLVRAPPTMAHVRRMDHRRRYEVGRRLLALGVVSAGDMTTEACVTKLAYLCGRGLEFREVRAAMGRNLRGEITEPGAASVTPMNAPMGMPMDRPLNL